MAPVLGALAGCSSRPPAPYLLTDYRQHQRGVVEVCFDDRRTSIPQAQALAETVCKQYDRTAQFEISQRLQCDWQRPTLALFYCLARPGEEPAPLQPQDAPLRHNSTGQNIER